MGSVQPGGDLLHPYRRGVLGSVAQVCRGTGEKAGKCQGKTHWGRGVAGGHTPLSEAVHRPDEGQRGALQQPGTLRPG